MKTGGWGRVFRSIKWHYFDSERLSPKHIVVFKDSDRSNCEIGNLELISMADNGRRNSMWNRYPAELCNTIMLAGALKRKMRRLSGKEQN